MRRRLLKRPSAALVLAIAALFLALGGTAVGKFVITGRDIVNGTITGADIKDRSLTGVDIKKDSLTGTEIKESTLGKVPSAVNADTVGGKDASAFEAAAHWALISGSPMGATVLAQSGGFGPVNRVATGFYVVDVGTSTASKPLSATLNFVSAGFVSVAPCGGTVNNPGGVNCPLFNDANHVFVRTLNTAGAATDSTFYISIGG